MVRCGHQLQQKRLLLRVIGIGQFQGFTVKVFVCHAPRVFEVDVGFIHAALVDDAIAISTKERVHVVEVTATPVHKYAVIPDRVQLLPKAGKATFTTDALDDGSPRRGWNGQGNRFQPAIRTGASGIEVIEIQALFTQLIEVGGQVAIIAIAAQIFRTQAFNGNQHDVGMAHNAGVIDSAANIQRILADKRRVGFSQLAAQLLGYHSRGQAGVELLIVEFVVTEGCEELVRAVAGQFMLISVAALTARRILIEQLQAQPGHQQQAGKGGGTCANGR